MANLPTITREEIVDMVEELMLMGVEKRHEIWRVIKQKGLDPDPKTIGKYMDIVRRRARKQFGKTIIKNILRKELRKLTYMEKQGWLNFLKSEYGKEKSQALLTINQIMERRAKLMGLDTEERPAEKTLEDLIRDDDENEENKQTINRGAVLDSGQTEAASEIPAKQNPAISGQKSGESESDIKTEAERS